MNAEKILYEMDFSESEFIRDAEKRQYHVKNIALLGEKSKNGYRYLRDAMRKAVSMFEGIKVFINHPTTEEAKAKVRDVRNLAGKIVHARFDESVAKVKGDFIGLPNDEGKRFVDIAERMPEIAGMSQNAMGKFSKENGEDVVEEITAIESVDLVSSPATTAGIFENDNSNYKENNAMEYKDITLEELRIRRKDLCETLVAEGKVQGETSRDDEVAGLIEEKDKAVQEADTLKAKEAVAGKTALVDKLLADSKLPEEGKSDVFREQLIALKPEKDGETIEEQAKKLIDDRLAAISGKKGVKNMGGDKKLGESDTDEKPTLRKAE